MSDYDRIAEAIEFIAGRVERQPTLDEVADHVHLSAFHFQRLFSRWAGVSPKKYLQVLTVEHAKQMLDQPRPVLDVSNALGLSSGSRLHDHFVQLEAVTPGEFKLKGAGLQIEYGVHDSPFGQAFIAITARGVCSLVFLDQSGFEGALLALQRRWPLAAMHENEVSTRTVIATMFGTPDQTKQPISLYVSGTNFQVSVWRALIQVPPARLASYADIAAAVGCPRAARAVGSAMGANPVAFLIPCHRVIRQTGHWGGYRWGETRKQAIHAWEVAQET